MIQTILSLIDLGANVVININDFPPATVSSIVSAASRKGVRITIKGCKKYPPEFLITIIRIYPENVTLDFCE